MDNEEQPRKVVKKSRLSAWGLPNFFLPFFWIYSFSYELTYIMYIYLQCLQDDGVVVIPSQVIHAPCVCKQRCLWTSSHIDTYTSCKVSQSQSQCGNGLSFRGIIGQWGHIDSWLIHSTTCLIGLDNISAHCCYLCDIDSLFGLHVKLHNRWTWIYISMCASTLSYSSVHFLHQFICFRCLN